MFGVLCFVRTISGALTISHDPDFFEQAHGSIHLDSMGPYLRG